MSIRVKVYGDKLDLADELEESFHAEGIDAMNEASDLVVAQVKRLLASRPGTKRTAAPEGQSPEIDTGDLLKATRRINARVKGRAIIGGLRINDPGANRVEFGGTDARGIRTLPHPYVRPSFKAMEPVVDALLQRRLT